MLQTKHLVAAAALCAAGSLVGLAARAETAPLPTLKDSAAPVDASSETVPTPSTDVDATAEIVEVEPVECPPGQFPSAFADVYPWHWAYQAVNNLASPNMICFDLPEEVR